VRIVASRMTTATSRSFLFSEATSGEADMDMFNGLPTATTITNTIPHHSPIVHRLSPPPPNLRLFSNHQLILLAPLKDTPTSNTTFLKIFAWIFEYRSIVWNQLKSESIVTFLHAGRFRSSHRWGRGRVAAPDAGNFVKFHEKFKKTS